MPGGIERGMMKDKDQKWYIDFLCLQYKYYNPNHNAVAEAFQLARQHLVSNQDAYFAVQELLYRFYRKKSERQFEQRRREMSESYVPGCRARYNYPQFKELPKDVVREMKEILKKTKNEPCP
nr:MAG: hypothetical protein [Bacteriophage sp.]UVN11135.1 MAG: hypothetical protein [Bacteriophage sp.]UVX33947.1 MAG: hypothetical protein [Bacteriophage sp.]UVX37188.1 MAG: hypothetical protein [Bacteriophage sp.]UVX79438.1 MAG: hypothetical protein [Bacteriophage sp.]